jgi:hypothetical protein
MPSVKPYLDRLDETRAPDLWHDIEHRIPRHDGVPPSTGPRRPSRLIAATVALLVFAVAGTFAWLALRPASSRNDVTAQPQQEVVVRMTTTTFSSGLPTASLTLGQTEQKGQPISFKWGDAIADTVGPSIEDYVPVPVGSVLRIEGEASVFDGALQTGRNYPYDPVQRLNFDGNAATLTAPPGDYALELTGTFPKGRVTFYFGVHLVSSRTVDEPSPRVLQARVAETWPVGPNGQTSAVAYGEGSLWVAYYRAESHLMRLDPATGAELADIPLAGGPTWSYGNGGIAFGAGGVWVTGVGRLNGEQKSQAILSKVDPTTNKVVQEIPLGGQFGADVAIDGTSVWVLVLDEPMRVVRVDPADGTVDASIDLETSYGHWLFSAGGRIIALTNDTHNGTVGDSVLEFVDPATNAVSLRLPLGSFATAAVQDDRLWVGTGSKLEQIDPATGEVISSVDSGHGARVIGEGALWAYDAAHPRLIATDPETGQTLVSLSLDPDTAPTALAVSPGAVWVLSTDGSLTKVEVSSA